MPKIRRIRRRLVRLALVSVFLLAVGFSAIAADLKSSQRDSASFVTPATVEATTGRESESEAARLLNEGRQRYAAGQFKAAALVWQQAAQAYQTLGNRLNQALSLSYLSLAYQEVGDWTQAKQAIATSLDLLKPSSDRENAATAILAQVFNTQGKLQLAMGQAQTALESWQTAERLYSQSRDVSGVLGSQINQAQALQSMGLYRRAQLMLEQANGQLHNQPASPLKATGLRSLGEVWQVIGNFTQAQTTLQESLAIAQQLNLPAESSATLFSLGNTLRAMQDPNAALKVYQQAAETAPTTIARLEAEVNQFSLLVEQARQTDAQGLLRQIEPELAALSPSRTGIYVQVNLATSLMKMAVADATEARPSPLSAMTKTTAQILATAVSQARTLQDPRAESYALGQLGYVYEQTQQWQEAKTLTQQALQIAQTIDAADIAYRWQWQLGRLQHQQGDRTGAIAAYTESVTLLKSLRGDLVATSPDVQFSFRESVEPVYRELVSLLVQSPQKSTNGSAGTKSLEEESPSQTDLKHAREVIEALQLAELENFLRSACLNARSSQIDSIDAAAAVLYPIILPDRLTVILALPKQPLKTYSVPLPKAQTEAVLEHMLESLNPVFADQERLRLSEQVYDWLIRPADEALAQSKVSTLVFVLDGTLRNLPMAALYDGRQYLVEKYNIGIAPGLQLLEQKLLVHEKTTNVLIGGLTEARQGFSSLPGVSFESSQIASRLSSKVLLNRDFTQSNLQSQFQGTAFPLVHLATHGQFSSNLSNTFILTWDNRVTIDGMRQLLRSGTGGNNYPIELLVLSACETATGDNRAALGLAGLAVRSGARSTLATLWSVNDASTANLMVEFYNALTDRGLGKAASLRQAQLKLLHNPDSSHPFYWAPFILVGNWM